MTKNALFMIIKSVAFISLVGIGFNCAAPRQRVTISMDQELTKGNQTVSAAWMAYGMQKALWRTKTFFEKNPGATVYGYSFMEEVECRRSLAEIWLDLKKKDGSTDPYLDDLAAVVKAGFIREYVWHYFRQADWIAPADMHEEAYESWAQNAIPNHTCITLATVSSGAGNETMTPQEQQQAIYKAIEAINGKRFKKAESLLEQVVSFAPAGWKAFSESNDSIFCAFWDTVEMNRCIREQPDRVVIPCFPSYSRAYYLLGFIAIEKGNAERALVQLNKGLALQPDHPVILLEKATVLSMRKQPEEAYECYVLAEKPNFASTLNILARALRGQGVALIDLNRLDEAEVCLRNSLKYEPDNKVAMNEIEYIRRLHSGEAAPDAEVKIKKVKVK